MKAAFANRLWLLTSRRAARDFHSASQHVAETQALILKNYLTRNRHTEYIDKHTRTQVITTRQLPLTTYEDYLPYIERIANGEKNILTRDPVQLFELSSGSTSASKMIPYTQTLKREFGFGLASWISDLYAHHPALVDGPAYWSISPLISGSRHTPAGIPLGFEEDSAYLGTFGALIESALAVPNAVKHIQDVNSFRYVTLLFLLRCKDLRLISVWNPTFLTLLLTPLSQWWNFLLRDISDGAISPPAPIEEALLRSLNKKLTPDKNRAQLLSKLKPDDYESIWQHLALISCWADGASESYAKELQALFPNVTIQPKGLLATEAFVSFPLTGKTGGALAVTSHYFEFMSETGDIFLTNQLEKGKNYSVIVTTGGGLYRYQLNDVVEATDFYNQIPCFKFIGKADRVSDYFGEKLNEQFVANALTQLFKEHNLSPAFYLLAPEDTPPFHYTLYLELPTNQLPDYLTTSLDSALRENFHYDYCRKLGQLAEAQMALIKNGSESYIRACQERGQKLGDIKPAILQKSTGWEKRFEIAPDSSSNEFKLNSMES
jgi:hypothetical protein